MAKLFEEVVGSACLGKQGRSGNSSAMCPTFFKRRSWCSSLAMAEPSMAGSCELVEGGPDDVGSSATRWSYQGSKGPIWHLVKCPDDLNRATSQATRREIDQSIR